MKYLTDRQADNVCYGMCKREDNLTDRQADRQTDEK